jgi:formylglycine-generating enzyme required for sulfatase activity
MKSPSILFSIVAAVTWTFGVSSSTVHAQCTADLNQDGQIDQADIAQLLANSGPVPFPPPAAPSVITPTWATLLEAAPDPAVVTDASLRDAIVASGFAWRIKDTSSDIEMILIPAGFFRQGCSPGDTECSFRESPSRDVVLTNAFYMGKTEVTQAQWVAKMGSNPSQYQALPDSSSRPVEKVSWNMIASGSTSFMARTGLRLPTEAEWEFACRAGTTTPRYYPEVGFILWFSGNIPTSGPQPVAGKLPNALGLYDTLGNVWEWCQDWYEPYSSSSQINPTGPAGGTRKAMRGGSFADNTSRCRSSARDTFNPTTNFPTFGFRVARTP